MASRSVLFAEPGLALQPEQPVEGQERGVANHGSAGLLASSAGRGWSGLAAELRSHSGVIAKRNPRPDTEICIDVHGGGSVVTRQTDGITDRTVSERGTIWLCPARGPESVIEMSDPLPHIYLPPSQKGLTLGSAHNMPMPLRSSSGTRRR
jgi:AraC family transcriptional regulator